MQKLILLWLIIYYLINKNKYFKIKNRYLYIVFSGVLISIIYKLYIVTLLLFLFFFCTNKFCFILVEILYLNNIYNLFLLVISLVLLALWRWQWNLSKMLRKIKLCRRKTSTTFQNIILTFSLVFFYMPVIFI